MLAVISIILILSAFVMVGVFSAQEAGRLANCKSNLSQLHKLMMAYTSTYGGFLPAMWHERWVGELGLVGKAWGNMMDDIEPKIAVVWNNLSPVKNYVTDGEERVIFRTGAPFLLCRSDLTGFRCDQGCYLSYIGLKKYGWWHRGSLNAQQNFFMYKQIQEVEDPSRGILLAETEPGTWQFAGCGCRWQSFSDPEMIVKRHFNGGNILHFDGRVHLAKTDEEREITYWEGPEYGQNWNVGW
jgi:hypothetical protein